MSIIKVALCEGRHTMPEGVQGSIFPNTINPTDVESIEQIALDFMEAHKEDDVHVYVTGLTVALVAVINAAVKVQCADLTLHHYDRDTGDYFQQPVDTGDHLRYENWCLMMDLWGHR